MAFSYVDYVGDGVQTAYSFHFAGDGFGYFRASDIHVFVAGVEVTNWTLTAPNQLTFTVAPIMGARILIRRIVPKDLPYSVWKRGNDFSPLTTNNSFLQQLYALQELYDGFMTEGFRFNQDLSLGGYRITQLGKGINDTDAATVGQLLEANVGAGDSANRAKQYADDAKNSKDISQANADLAVASVNRAILAETNAGISAQTASTAAEQTSIIRDDAFKAAARVEKGLADFIPLEQSANIAATTATNEAAKATSKATEAKSSADTAKSEADRAKAYADSLDTSAINARFVAVEQVNTAQGTSINALQQEDTSIKASITALGNVSLQFKGTVTDLDATVDAGIYNAAPANSQPSASGVLTVLESVVSLKNVSGNFITQHFYGTNNRVYTRQAINGAAWTAWTTNYDSTNMTFEF